MKKFMKIFFSSTVFLIAVSFSCWAQEPNEIDKTIDAITESAVNKDFNEVMVLFKSLIDQPDLTESQRAQIYYLRGWAYQMLSKEYDKAIADYSLAIELNTDVKWTFSSLINRSGCYLDQKEYDKAVADVEGALQIWPEHPVALSKQELILQSMQSEQEEK